MINILQIIGSWYFIIPMYFLTGWLILQAFYLSENGKYDGYAISFWILWPLAMILTLILNILNWGKEVNKRIEKKEKKEGRKK